jgi:hypothetical protein
MSESVALGTTESNGRGNGSAPRISFSDVARAHYGWDSRSPVDSGARKDFDQKLGRFEEQSGELVEAYWCRKEASAVALFRLAPRPPGRLERLRGWLGQPDDVPDFRLYRETDWVTGEFSRLADLLHECDVLAIKAIYGLEGFQRATVMQWLLKVEAHILGYIEWRHPTRADAEPKPEQAEAKPEQPEATPEQNKKERRKAADQQLDTFYGRTLRELNKIEDYYQQAGEKRARLRYVEGMIIFGVVFVAVAAVLSALVLSLFGLLDLHAPGVRRFYACMAAGGVGAVVSVLIRMSGRGGGFTIDHELGSLGVRRLGAFRPLIGAVSGVIVSLLVQTSLVPINNKSLSIEFFVVVAFLAGFSERWTKVVLAGAMRTVEKTDGGEDKTPPQTPVTGEGGSS